MNKMENCELVQKGFRTLLVSLSGYIGKELNTVYGDKWWDEVLNTLYNNYDLPRNGSYGELIDSLDIANCLHIIERKWNDVFTYKLPKSARSWVNELVAYRNAVAHLGQQDLEQMTAERALNTMLFLCNEIDPDNLDEIKNLYLEVRTRATENNFINSYEEINQPLLSTHNKDGVGLLDKIGSDLVQKTSLTRKITFGGETLVYPVYRVRLDALFYNDQNDRIATWISAYESENGKDSLSELPIDLYNRVIENFIFDSDKESIKNTQNGILMRNQQVPGVTLADGRVVDGNRRFTCLRRIQRDTKDPVYFETVIMDADIKVDRKQIKLLELAIQHGEEGKVGYD